MKSQNFWIMCRNRFLFVFAFWLIFYPASEPEFKNFETIETIVTTRGGSDRPPSTPKKGIIGSVKNFFNNKVRMKMAMSTDISKIPDTTKKSNSNPVPTDISNNNIPISNLDTKPNSGDSQCIKNQNPGSLSGKKIRYGFSGDPGSGGSGDPGGIQEICLVLKNQSRNKSSVMNSFGMNCRERRK